MRILAARLSGRTRGPRPRRPPPRPLPRRALGRGGRVIPVEALTGFPEASLELAPRLAGHGAEPGPCGARRLHFLDLGPALRLGLGRAADRVAGERLHQPASERVARELGAVGLRFRADERLDPGAELLLARAHD